MPRGEPDTDGGLCRCCFRLIITSSFTALFLYLALRTNRPTLSIESLTLTSNKTTTLLTFDLKIKNRNKDKGVYYESLSLAFFNTTTSNSIANASFPPFYQGHAAAAHRLEAVEVSGGVGRGLRVEVETGVRYKVVLWRTKRERVRVSAALTVNGEGSLVRGKKGVKLTSDADGLCYSETLRFVCVVVVCALCVL